MNIAFSMNGVLPDSPLLYRILINNRICYIGCANTARRPQVAYSRNVKRMIEGKPYRKNKPEGFRLIHRRLFEAVQNGENVLIELIRNVARENKFAEERAEIAEYSHIVGIELLNQTTIQIKNPKDRFERQPQTYRLLNEPGELRGRRLT